MKSKEMNKCPRCNLPQEGMYSCEYCGYVFTGREKKHGNTLRNRLKAMLAAFSKETVAPGKKASTLKDNGGTRSGMDRRRYKFKTYYPENRSGKDRRKGIDRRRKVASRIWAERRFSLNHQIPHPRNS